MGQALLMGRKTFDGMNRRVLPGRETIILTKDEQFQADGVTVLNSVEQVINWFQEHYKTLFIVPIFLMLIYLSLKLSLEIILKRMSRMLMLLL